MAFFLYLAQLSIYAALMWGIYCLVWRNRPLHRYSRYFLLVSLVLPPILPLVQIPVSDHSTVAAYSVSLPEVIVNNAKSTTSVIQPFLWAKSGVILYLTISVLIGLAYLLVYVRLNRALRKGQSIKFGNHNVIIETGLGPGTINRRIFFPGRKIDETILRHELEHIRAGHRYDLILTELALVLFWVSPAHWLIRKELKLVHEFEADHAATSSVDISKYVALLLASSFDSSHLSIAHSFFHHPLKRRIKMLQLSNSHVRRGVIFAFAGFLMIIFSGVALIAQTRKKQAKGDGEFHHRMTTNESRPFRSQRVGRSFIA